MLKRIVAISFVDALTKLASYILLPVFLAIMPKDQFGEYTYINTAILYVSLVMSLSLYVPLIRYYCETNDFEVKKKLLSTVILTLFIFMVLVDLSLILWRFSFIQYFKDILHINNYVNEKYIFVIILINTSTLSLYLYSIIIATNVTKLINYFILCKFTLITLFSISIIYLNPFGFDTVLNRLIGATLAECIFVIFYAYILLFGVIRFNIDYIVFKKIIKISLPLIPSGVIGLLLALFDRFLIVKYHGFTSIASYNLAFQALAPVQLVVTAVQTVWAPNFYSLSNLNEAFSQSRRIMWIVFSSMMIASILIALMFKITLHMGIVSESYQDVPYIVLGMSLGTIFTQLIQLNNNLIVKMGVTVYQLYLSGILLLISASINYVLIPLYSLHGAIIAMNLSSVIVFFLGYGIIVKKIKKSL